MGKIANIIGATGLVGKELCQLLLEDSAYSKVRIFTRKETGLSHPKLEEQVIDFSEPGSWSHLVTGDVLFSALGTTKKQAGSQKAQYEVDYTFNYEFAKAASTNKVPNYVLVSSAGANPNSRVFYSRIKGELDAAVSKLGFGQVCLLRPSVLVGERPENRAMEKAAILIGNFLSNFIFKKYRPIKGEVVAKAMANSIKKPNQKKVMVYSLDEVFLLGN